MMHALIFRLCCLFLICRITYQTEYSCDSKAPCGCSQFPVVANARIVNGENAGRNTLSWAVSIKIQANEGYYQCGGTIIDDSYIITAAHCVDFIRNPSDISVYAGSLHVFDGVVRSASEIHVHPYYDDQRNRNDIALLKLDRALDLSNDNLSKICLPSTVATSGEYPIAGTSLLAAGWGDKWSEGPSSTTLQQVTIQAVGAQTTYCQHIIEDPTVQLCAGTMPGSEKDTCQGDSGGPLMMFNANQTWELVGIISYGRDCAVPDYPGVYTRVTSYLEWINTTIPYTPTSPTTLTTTLPTTSPTQTTATKQTTTTVFDNSSSSIGISTSLFLSMMLFLFKY
ncbi:unnamed protein product [Adineta steineri]|uniref:Peptidase S1 domain-containing protein n=1 Tax=Adineta steineri TaxID=433720 RepID=A0A816BET4_9BILA|nr:unnamed protein product [Adineta steineri]CAF1608236.1 unnamed protein product [Adineta steineri]